MQLNLRSTAQKESSRGFAVNPGRTLKIISLISPFHYSGIPPFHDLGYLYRKALLKSFHLNGHAWRYISWSIQKLESPCSAYNNKQNHRKVLLSSFHLNGHTSGFHLPIQKL